MLISVLAAILPVPLFYMIYYRHFSAAVEKRETAHLKHFEAFLGGIAAALAIIMLSPLIGDMLYSRSVFFQGFVKAALIEKLSVMAIIFLVQRHYPSFSLMEAVMSGILAGTGFSLVENFLYALDYGGSVVMVRTLFSVPLHISTCGLMGFFLGISNLSSTGYSRAVAALKAFLVPFILHGAYDVLLLKGNAMSCLIGPIVILITGMLEICISWSGNVPSREALGKQGLRFEDWKLKHRQPRFERWILNSMGTSSSIHIPFLAPSRGPLLWVLVVFFLAAGAALFPLRHNTVFLIANIRPHEEVLIATIFPVSLAFILAIVGSVNPRFFTGRVVSLPVIFDAVASNGSMEIYTATFDITHTSCFLTTFEPMETGEGARIYFEISGFRSPEIGFREVWRNHGESPRDPAGTIIRFISPGKKFYIFLARYYFIRLVKGIVFNLKLPGSRGLMRLFIHPSTVMNREIVCQSGSVVFRQGEEESRFYLIRKGTVDFYRELASGERILVDTMGQGQIFNEMALLGDRRRTVTAECRTMCILAEAKADNLEALIRNNPDFACALVIKLAQRADQTQNYLTQSIEYLKTLAEFKSRRARNVSLLLAMTGAGCSPVGEGTFALEVDLDEVSSRLNADPREVLDYVRSILIPGESAGGEGVGGESGNIENMLSGFSVQMRADDRRPALIIQRKSRQ